MLRFQAASLRTNSNSFRTTQLPNLAFLLIAISLPTCLAAQTENGSRDSQNGEVLYSVTVEEGIIFIDGEYVAAPYEITASEDAIFVNQIPMNSTIKLQGHGERGEGGRGEGGMQQPRGRGEGGPQQQRGRRGPANVPMNGPRRGQPRRTDQFRQQRPGDNGLQQQSTVRQAERLSEILINENSIILAFTETPLVAIESGDRTYCLCSHFVGDGSNVAHQERILAATTSPTAKSKIQEWLNNYQPPAELLAKMQLEVDFSDAIIAEDNRVNSAMARMDKLAYPITLIAMMLGVIALGHMLKWTGQSIVSNQNGTITKESIRGAEVALLLMAGMSAVDLGWTILASQAGAMREVNPLAAGLIDSPIHLAAFKFIATSLGFGLLYVLRTQKRGQEVTWWMCLVCILVTFRWVLFDSMA